MERTAGEKGGGGGGGALWGSKGGREFLKGVDMRCNVQERNGENEEGRIMWKYIIDLSKLILRIRRGAVRNTKWKQKQTKFVEALKNIILRKASEATDFCITLSHKHINKT